MKKGKRIWSFLLALCLIVTQLPAVALAETTGIGLYIGNSQDSEILLGSYYKYDGTGGVSAVGTINDYNAYVEQKEDRYVLYLKNASYIKGSNGVFQGAGIYYSGNLPLEIVFEGSNEVYAGACNSGYPSAIYVVGQSLILSGTGTLKADAREHGSTNNEGCYGIRVDGENGNLIIKSGTVEAYAGSARTYNYGINIESGTLNIEGTANVYAESGETSAGPSAGINGNNGVTITGGIVNAQAAKAKGGISAGILSYKDINISGGTVTAAGGNETELSSCGIYSSENVNISDGTVTATGNQAVLNSIGIGAASDIAITGSATVNATGNIASGGAISCSYGIGGTNITISDSVNITATGGNVRTTGNSYGIGASGNLTISGGDSIIAKAGNPTAGNSYGIGATGKLNVNGGTIEATGGIPTAGSSFGVGVGAEGQIQGVALASETGTSNINVTAGKLTATGSTAANGLSYGIGSTGNINVENGTIVANGGENSIGSVGLCASQNFNVSGGNISAKGGNATGTAAEGIPGQGASGGNSFGIGIRGTADINGGTINAQSGTTTRGSSCGFGAANLNVSNNANMKLYGGTAQNGNSYGAGVSENCTVLGGSIVATGGNAEKGNSFGIGTTGIYKQNGGTVTATGGNATAGATGTGCSYGIGSQTNIDLSGNGTLTAKSGTGVMASYGCGAVGTISAILDNLTLNISGGTLAFGAVGGGTYTKDGETVTMTGKTYTLGQSDNGGSSIYVPSYYYYTINVKTGEGGSITTTGNNSVMMGQNKTYIITPNEGYVISDVLIDGVSIGTVSSYTFETVYNNHTIEAYFIKETKTEDSAGENTEDNTGITEEIKMDTSFGKLCLKSKKSTKTTNKLIWRKVSDADGYVVYGAQCNTKSKTYKVQKLEVIKDGTITNYTDKDLKEGTYYKYYVKAYKLVDGKKVFIAKSKVIRAATTGGKYGNVKSVKVNDSDVTLKVGKKFTIEAKQVKNDKPVKSIRAIQYESGNKSIATVSKNGVITAKGTGSCYIYVYAQNGIYTKVKVTVE